MTYSHPKETLKLHAVTIYFLCACGGYDSGDVLQSLGAVLVSRQAGVAWAAPANQLWATPEEIGSCLEDVRVWTCHRVGHHCARQSPHYVHPGCVAAQLTQRLVDYADNTQRVTALLVRQAPGALHILAVIHIWRTWVNEGGSSGISVGGHFGPRVPLSNTFSTGVQLRRWWQVS
jgi:hypothetical protein